MQRLAAVENHHVKGDGGGGGGRAYREITTKLRRGSKSRLRCEAQKEKVRKS